MAKLSNYKGSIGMTGGFTPKGGLTFPLMEAHDIVVDESGKRLDEKLGELGEGGAGSNNDIPVATQTSAGLMSADDKKKLDLIPSGSNVVLPEATTSTAGLMSSLDKQRVDILWQNQATVYYVTLKGITTDELGVYLYLTIITDHGRDRPIESFLDLETVIRVDIGINTVISATGHYGTQTIVGVETWSTSGALHLKTTSNSSPVISKNGWASLSVTSKMIRLHNNEAWS